MPIPSEILADICQQLFFHPGGDIAGALMKVKGVVLHYAGHVQQNGVALRARKVNRIALV